MAVNRIQVIDNFMQIRRPIIVIGLFNLKCLLDFWGKMYIPVNIGYRLLNKKI